MPKTYEHTFNDLGGNPDEDSTSVVDLGPATADAQDATGRVTLNPSPGNPDKGKADQFGDIVSPPAKDEVDDGIDIASGDEPVEDSATTDSDEDDLSGLSKSVRERIQRERRMRVEAEDRTRNLEAQVGSISAKIELQGKETEWNRQDEKDDTTLNDLRQQKIKALEAGETEKAVDLDDKITDVKATKRARETERQAARKAVETAAKTGGTETSGVHPKAQAWIKAHPQYNSDPLFQRAARQADQLLHSMGHNVNSDDYYVRLTRLLSDKFDVDPGYMKLRKGNKTGQGGTGSTGVRGGASAGDVRRSDSGRTQVTITKADKAFLASMGQDADDPAVLRAYAREKVALERASRGGDR